MELTGKSLNTIYTQKCIDIKNGKGWKYKKLKDNSFLIDATEEYKSIALQERFEKAYYDVIDFYDSQWEMSRDLSKLLNLRHLSIDAYLNKCFTSSFVKANESKAKLKYTEGLEELLKHKQ